jgi:hypothetical protein
MLDYFNNWNDVEDNLVLVFRAQDEGNYMATSCYYANQANYRIDNIEGECNILRVINGEEQKIPGSEFEIHKKDEEGKFTIEARGNTYRIYFDGEQVKEFVDNSFANGGFQWRGSGTFEVDSIEVRSLINN